MENTVTVTGVGRVREVPDVAQLDVTLEADGSSPSAAYTDVSDVVRRVTAVLAEQDVAPADRQTRSLTLQPRHDYGGSSGEPRLVGYRATITLAVRIVRLPAVPTVLDALVAAAGDALRLDRFVLAASEPDRARHEAETAAVVDAQDRARRLAAAADATVGPVLTLRHDAGGHPPPGPAPRAMALGAAVEPGEHEVTATVTATFALVR